MKMLQACTILEGLNKRTLFWWDKKKLKENAQLYLKMF
jgi:hypothetical protein